MRIWFFLAEIFFFGTFAAKGFAQGAAVVLPLSKYVFTAEETISFQIHNQLKEELILKFEPQCEIDGQELIGEACYKFFAISFDNAPKDGNLKLAKSGSVQGSLALRDSKVKYALFKPLISPVMTEDKKSQGLTFEFKYQPGYLFIIQPSPALLGKVIYTEKVTPEAKVAHFEVDLSSLPMPSVASISARMIDMTSKQMIRFVRLASDKILDPKRGKMELESPYAEPGNMQQACYELIVQWTATKNLQKLSNCI